MPEPISNPIDMTKVEAVRLHLKLRQSDMAVLFGVSRITYIRWTKGYQVRSGTQKIIRSRLRELLGIIRDGWPPPETMALRAEQRFAQLLAKLE